MGRTQTYLAKLATKRPGASATELARARSTACELASKADNVVARIDVQDFTGHTRGKVAC
jgi:hypothetical protein